MTVTARRELVSPATRNAFRSLATDLTLRIVAELWEDHGFAPIPPDGLKYQDSGQRRTEFMLYAEGVDWSDPNQVRRALLVFEDFIRAYRDPGLRKIRSSPCHMRARSSREPQGRAGPAGV
ncbi:hypothetical protein OHB53_09665 [Streptomyces sp. NBC_00056]|uniref:hypothetical protein n=1 Tax=Streptomyces sp. NBC_00056 TaxID=2975633 RepID=UPI00324CB795